MADPRKPRGPLTHRVFILFFTIVLGLLAYWSLGFVMEDIETLRGPDLQEVENRVLNPQMRAQDDALARQENSLESQRRQLVDEQEALRTSTANAQETMNQLLQLQKQGALGSPDAAALSRNKQIFLANQAKFQQLSEQIETLRQQIVAIDKQRAPLAAELAGEREEASRQFEDLRRRHEWKKAALKIGFLLPILFVVFYFFRTRRTSMYAPILYAAGAAVVWTLFEVLHQYFPSRYFKYILMAVAIFLVVQVLVFLLRMIITPKRDFLLKQYREAYERFACPVCEYPIRRGPLRYAFWTKRTIKKLALPEPAAGASDDPYSCPVCGVTLFEKCPNCGGIRHSLLPNCEKCGAAKEVPVPAPAA